MALLGVAIVDVYSHIAITGYKNPLHITTYLSISLESSPLWSHHKNYHMYTKTNMHKNSKGVNAAFLK